jgi:pimeloyl-ACP methyl ester carboxylesterase
MFRRNGSDMKTAAVCVHALAKSLGITNARIVGHDIGLMVAYAYELDASSARFGNDAILKLHVAHERRATLTGSLTRFALRAEERVQVRESTAALVIEASGLTAPPHDPGQREITLRRLAQPRQGLREHETDSA